MQPIIVLPDPMPPQYRVYLDPLGSSTDLINSACLGRGDLFLSADKGKHWDRSIFTVCLYSLSEVLPKKSKPVGEGVVAEEGLEGLLGAFSFVIEDLHISDSSLRILLTNISEAIASFLVVIASLASFLRFSFQRSICLSTRIYPLFLSFLTMYLFGSGFFNGISLLRIIVLL